MKLKFLYADFLKKKFSCYGHFYKLKLSSSEIIDCRSVLEIVNPLNKSIRPDRLYKEKADAVFVMMNPGSSYPIDPPIEDIRFGIHDFLKPKRLVLTRPDNTQYQVMRIAMEKNWRHVRVLNLSDIRNPKSVDFIKQLNDLSKANTHSIFSACRDKECKLALNRKNDPIILGWGQLPELINLSKQCMKRIQKESVVMVESDINKFLNLHPSPMLQSKKEDWLEQILSKLN